MKKTIAICFGEWGQGSGGRGFRRPAAYAAFIINARRKQPNDPILNAQIVESLIGSELKTRAWLLEQPGFTRHFAPTPAEIASTVAGKMPRFLNW